MSSIFPLTMLRIKTLLGFTFLAIALTFSAHFIYKKRSSLLLMYRIHAAKPVWVQKQLASDFEPFVTVTQEALNKTQEKILRHNILAYRYRIIDNVIYRTKKDHIANHVLVFDKILKRLRRSAQLPNMDFLVCMMDGVPEVYVPSDFWIVEEPQLQAPLLAWAKKKSAPYVVLIPDLLTTVEHSWQHDIALIHRAHSSIPWNERIEKAFWRGTASDKGYTLENFSQKPRFLLSQLSTQYPEKINAGFSKANEKEWSDLFQKIGVLKGRAPILEHLRYKYLPVLDGWMCTYPGFQWRLLSGSLTLKQESDEVQYFYSALKPYEHYLPIQNDMGDLLEKLQWAAEHDAECRQIAENAHQFAQNNLMPDRIYAYFYWVLKRYASIQAFDTKELKKQTQDDPSWMRVD